MKWIAINHTICGQVAFYYSERPSRGEPVDGQKAMLLDGSQPIKGTYMICGSCGKLMNVLDVEPEGGFR